MSTLGPDRAIKSRTEHKCDLCGLRIRRGATYVYREGVEGREHWRMRMHFVCEAATDKWSQIDWECGLDPLDFRRYELDLRRGTVLNIVTEMLKGIK